MLHLNDNLIAHNVKTSGNVAATFHIEPNHNPKAGELSKAWFALTKPGGEVIPLDRCNCQLRVISNHQTVLQPSLQSISAEQYQGIPGAEITFPKAGIYTLEMRGQPKNDDEFNSFKFTYDVTVQAGAVSQQSSPEPTAGVVPSPRSMNYGIWIGVISAIVILTCAWIVKRTLKN